MQRSTLTSATQKNPNIGRFARQASEGVGNQSALAKADSPNVNHGGGLSTTLPHIHLDIGRRGKRVSKHLQGECAQLAQRLMVKGGITIFWNTWPELEALIRRLRRFYGLRIGQRRVWVNRQPVDQYWLMEHVHSFVGVCHG